MLKDSFSEEEVEDPVVEIVCGEGPIESAQRQFTHLVWQDAVGIPVDDRHLIPLDVEIRPIARKLRGVAISGVQDAGILHLDISRRLEVYVRCDLRQKLV
jgi:hypothetical protein